MVIDVQNQLFDEPATPVEISPAQRQKTLERRSKDRARQQRCRARAKGRDISPKSVTLEQQSVTLFSPPRPNELTPRSNCETTPEMELLLDALARLSRAGHAADRPAILRALEASARAAGVQIFHAAGWLEAKIESGVLPQIESEEWISVPREMLDVLMEKKDAQTP